MKILMVCLGNICRSPLAEGVLQKKLKESALNWQVDSAGTNSYHIGEAPHRLSQKIALQNGIDISCQVARQFVAADFKNYDLIYVMAQDVLKEIKKISGALFEPKKIKFFLEEMPHGKQADVPDPWYGEEDGYVKVYELINEACDAIVKKASATQLNKKLSYNG